MAPSKEFIGLVPPKEQRPPSAFNAAPAALKVLIRDQCTITTWLCLGAILQGGFFLAIGRLALLPAVLVVTYKVLLAYAQTVGWVRNPAMDDVIMKKFSAQFPDSTGHYGSKPAADSMVVFLIGARSNHPLGLLGPGYKQLGEYFDSMAKNLDLHAEEFGFLGMTRWINCGDRSANNEIMDVAYFRTVEGLHKFAHSQHHRVAWDWWNKDYSKFSHISLFHETYHVPKGGWETIYTNSHASQGINSTTHRFVDSESGQVKWASPVVDATSGLLKTSAGRMSRSQAGEHEKMGIVDVVYGDV